MTDPTLDALELFYDAVPRRGAHTEAHGPLVLFVQDSGAWPYYARPAAGGGPVSVADVVAVRERQRELGVPEAFEWVHEVAPSLTEAAERAGLVVERCPLLVLDGAPAEDSLAQGVWVRTLGADDPDLPLAEAVASVGFSAGIGTRTGEAGVAVRDEVTARADAERLTKVRDMLRQGVVGRVVAGLHDGPAGPLATGGYQHAGGVAELVGIATLPAARRRGLGAAVTAALASEAHARGLGTVFLSAQDEQVAAVYERVGFRRVGTAGIAAPPPPAP